MGNSSTSIFPNMHGNNKNEKRQKNRSRYDERREDGKIKQAEKYKKSPNGLNYSLGLPYPGALWMNYLTNQHL